jgi:membrane protease YdiL (CAAX protease family)
MGRAGSNPRNLITSLMLVFPLMVIYHAGILLTHGVLNGADFVTQIVVSMLGRDRYWMFVIAVTVGFVVALAMLRRKQHVHPRTIVPLLLESTIYALTMGGLISLIMVRVLHLSPPRMGPMASAGPFTNVIMSIGAGVYEETVFRLGLLSGLIALFERLFALRRFVALTLAFALSSAVFSAVHGLGPLRDPNAFAPWVFTFRFLAGAIFGLLFWFRGFAVAVYTHAIYDVIVLVLGSGG